MAQQTLNNTAPGAPVVLGDQRSKINANFTELYAAFLSALKAPTSWAASVGGGAPALTSGTAVVGTAYKNTTAGTTVFTTPIDGIPQVALGDMLICLAAGTYTYFPAGGVYLGVLASIGVLPTAASNAGNFAIVGTAFYICNGAAWVQIITSAQVGATGGVAPNGDTVQVAANVTISVANANVATYNGKVLEFTGAFTVTLAAGLPNDFGFAGIVPSSGNASVVGDGTTSTVNGSATTPVTRSAASYTMFAVVQRNTSRNAYVVN